jgi:hypothetical protein
MVITAITRSYPMIVTAILDDVTESNSYINGQLLRLFVPYGYGMIQANDLVGKITNISGLNFTLDIDSSQFDPFVVPVSTIIQPASFSPAGSRNLEYSNFTNAVPFQSLNNVGN